MLDRNPSREWGPTLTLAEDTMFQCQAGAMYLDIGAAAEDLDDGLFMAQDPERPLRDTVVLPAGVSVRWRQAGERKAKLYWAPVV